MRPRPYALLDISQNKSSQKSDALIGIGIISQSTEHNVLIDMSANRMGRKPRTLIAIHSICSSIGSQAHALLDMNSTDHSSAHMRTHHACWHHCEARFAVVRSNAQ